MRILLALGSLLLLLPGALPLKAASLESYLPLKEGLVWEFRHQFGTQGDPAPRAEARAVKKNLPPTEIQGLKVYPQVYTFHPPGEGEKQETTSYIAADAHGYYVWARKTGHDSGPRLLSEKFYILKQPLQKGASWVQKDQGLTLHQVVQETKAQVTVPAGTFTDCLLIKRSVFESEKDQTPTSEIYFWFAPQVGNVKVVTKLPGQKQELTQELVKFTGQ